MYLAGACMCMSARSGDGGVKDVTDYVSNTSFNQASQIAGQGEGYRCKTDQYVCIDWDGALSRVHQLCRQCIRGMQQSMLDMAV
jgi:hypothetical protein